MKFLVWTGAHRRDKRNRMEKSFATAKMYSLRILVTMSLAAVAPMAAAQDAARGKTIFNTCKSCHQIGPSAKNRTGPVLTGVIGRPAASVAGFRYSPSLAKAGANGLVWTEDLLADWLSDPKKFLRSYLGDSKARSKMSKRVTRKQDRLDVIAYLGTFQSAALAPNAVCVRNDSAQGHFFAAEATGEARVTGWLEPGQALCAPAAKPDAHGVVSVFETADAFEGCSRVVSAGQAEGMLAYAEFDRCAWTSHQG